MYSYILFTKKRLKDSNKKSLISNIKYYIDEIIIIIGRDSK